MQTLEPFPSVLLFVVQAMWGTSHVSEMLYSTCVNLVDLRSELENEKCAMIKVNKRWFMICRISP